MQNIRLPSYVKPYRYDLLIKPDLKAFTFEGEESIFLTLGKSVGKIVLHAKELDVSNVSYEAGGFVEKASKISFDEKNETVAFSFNKSLPRGRGELTLKFKGILNDKMRGFYRSRYIYQGKEKNMATTQFEATDARRAFPNIDEPAHKAVFNVSLLIPKGLTAISNTIETSVTEHEGGYQLVKFVPTPKMSTYLLAFIVGDFEYIQSKTREGVQVRVFVTPGKKHQAKFALDTATKVLEFYNKYFDIPYPLPVLDLIAIPDFSHGAMENWGAVTYRESALLVDPKNSSASNKQWVALVIAHELAHQWFGNLVTMEWWTHLWLNEGFASYIEYLAVNEIFPNWDIWTQFAYADLGVALKLDSLKHTHPIEIEVGHPDEIGEIFDEVSYSKGASIIRMLAGYLGEKDFRDGLRYYLKKHAYKNASTADLWRAFEKISRKPIRKLMQNWTAKPGYPIIKVIEEGNKLSLKQSRFFASPISKKQVKDPTIWQVPVTIQSDGRNTKKVVLRTNESSVKKTELHWTKVNAGETGFYRVDYPSQMLNALKEPIIGKTLAPIDRLAIVRDAFALSEAGELPTVEVLNLLDAYKNETDYTVWVELLTGLSNLRNLLFGQSYYSLFEKFALSIMKSIGSEVGWQAKKGESHTAALLRSLVLQQLVAFNHKPTLEKGKTIFIEHKTIAADIRSVVYMCAAQTGSRKQHQMFMAKYKSETLSEEKNRLGRALGQFQNEELLGQSLEFALSKHVRIQDTPGIFMAIWSNPLGKNIAWQFTKKNWLKLLKTYPSSGHMLARFIKPASGLIKAKQAEELKGFFKKHPAPGASRAISQTLEKIYANNEWLNRDGKHIENWLNMWVKV